MSFLDIRSSQDLPKLRPHVYLKGFLPLLQSSVMMIYSFGGVGKSFLSIRLAYEYAIEEKQKKVALWLTEDPPAENRRRSSLICDHIRCDEADFNDRLGFINTPPVKFTKMEGNNAVLTQDFYRTREALSEYSLVIIDPLLQFQGCDENSNTHAGVLMGALKTWAAEEIKTILLLHHATPAEGQLGSGVARLKPRGAGEWVNGTRGVYQLNKLPSETPTPEEKRTLRATLVKDNGIVFYVRDEQGNIHRDLEIFPEVAPSQPTIPVVPFLSVANHNKAQEPKGFEKIDVYFRDLHNYVIGDCAYSPFAFRNSYRKGETNEGGATIICLDIDSGMTIEEARKVFFKYEALIATTRSHQKEKGSEAACDRYRVFLNLRTPLDIPTSEYGEFFNHLYGILKHVDPSTKDIARFYFASPLEAQYWYSEASTRYDWEPVYEAMKRHSALENVRKQISQNNSETPIRKKNGSEPGNTLPRDTLFSTKNGSVDFVTLRNQLSIGQKITCRCREDIDHGGLGHSHHSAFIQKADNGNVFYSCSGGRCASVGTLWCSDWSGS